MSTASAVMNAWATVPYPFNMIIAALAAATGAVQIATINQQENPYQSYRTGGWILGDDKRDRTLVNATAGEFIVSEVNARRNATALEFMQAGGTVRPTQELHLHFDTIIGEREWVESNLFPLIREGQRNGYLLTN